MKKTLIMCWVTIGLFCGCSLTMAPLPKPLSNLQINKDKWIDYGAVYAYYEFGVIQTAMSGSRYVVDFETHILSQDGMAFGTITPPYSAGFLAVLDVSVFDREGRVSKPDTSEIRSKYKKTGHIVIPNIEVGSKINVHMEYNNYIGLQAFEYWMNSPIPVLKSKFTFQTPGYASYNFKLYGDIAFDDSYSDPYKNKRYIWTANEILPKDDPKRIMIVAKFIGAGPSGWKAYSGNYSRYLMNKSILNNPEKIKSLSKEITANSKDERTKAEKILKYVQDTIVISDRFKWGGGIALDKVIAKGMGNVLEVTLLLNEMMKYSHINSRILLTRSHQNGGFDPKFPHPYYLEFPLVEVEIDKKKEIAYPLLKQSTLGEYPPDFYGLKSVVMGKDDIVNLPKPKYETAKQVSEVVLDLDNIEGSHSWHLIYSDIFASIMRSMFPEGSDKEKDKFFEEAINRFGSGNILETNKVSGLDQRGESVNAQMTFKNNEFITQKEGDFYISLEPFFYRYSSNFTPEERQSFTPHYWKIFQDKVIIKTDHKEKSTLHFVCEEVKNDLFEVHCRQSKTENGIELIHEFIMKDKELSSESMKKYLPALRETDQIKESYIILKR